MVQNPSFETYTVCPSTGGDLNIAVGWDNAKNTPDYFNVCGQTSFDQIPLNYFGYQNPANGNAYAGIYAYDASTPNYRELIIGTLITPMIIGQKYFVSYKVNRADSNYLCGYSTNNIGVRFTKTKYNLGFPNLSNVLMDNFAQVNTSSIITDTINWTKVKGTFVADSAYKYIMLGNFFDATNTTIFNHGNGNIAYYFIDEICLTTDSLFNEGYVTKLNKTVANEKSIKVYPNPFSFELNLNCDINSNIQIYTSLGELYYENRNTYFKTVKVNTATWQPGIYLLKINGINKLIIKN